MQNERVDGVANADLLAFVPIPGVVADRELR